jgi:DMSO/TMAO reductase YedYZ molybdopterin-dependent catalytic subunit
VRINPLAVLILFSCLTAGGPGRAADQAGFSVEGQVKQALHLSAADLKKLPVTQIEVSYEAQGRIQKGAFGGVPLLDILKQAGIVDGEGKGAPFRHAIEVSGSDGYTVTIAIGEIHPDLEAKQVLLAYLRDGQPVDPAGSVRLVVPGDKHGARGVRDVIRIAVK